MEGHEETNRVQEAIRRAAWQGAWRMLGIQLAILVPVSILFPACHPMRGSGVNKVNAARIADGIRLYRQSVGVWPTDFNALRSYLSDIKPLQDYRVSFLPVKATGAEAEYAIAVEGRVETWRIDAKQGLFPVDRKPVFGTLKP